MCTGQPGRLFLFLLENFMDGQSNVFTWGTGFHRRFYKHTQSCLFSLLSVSAFRCMYVIAFGALKIF